MSTSTGDEDPKKAFIDIAEQQKAVLFRPAPAPGSGWKRELHLIALYGPKNDDGTYGPLHYHEAP